MQRVIGPGIYVAAIVGAIGICWFSAEVGSLWAAYPLVFLFGVSITALMTYLWPVKRFLETPIEFREAFVVAAAALTANQLFFGPFSFQVSNAIARAIHSDAYIQFVHELPVWVAVPLVMVLSEGIGYLLHRWQHSNKIVWERSHSVHHEPNSFGAALFLRFSYGDYFLQTGIRFAVLNLFQFSAFSITVATTLGVLAGIVSHANTSLSFWGLNKILVTPDVHFWHHSPRVRVNYSVGLLNFFDRLGGTFFYPQSLPEELGIDGVLRARSGFEANLLRPPHWVNGQEIPAQTQRVPR
ncbi:MAG: hypothetical protein RI884_2588 [Pseudomonadota bacterium]|jgi:sterol desaturase/sphingolipid hydroxylase (fatty acid hydroxylase superfamily)